MINMFASATFKLTLIYMGILTLICLFFSYNWYTIATDELDRSYARERASLENIKKRPRLFAATEDSDDFVNAILEEARLRYEDAEQTILGRVIASNIIIISSGTLGSFFLARRTLAHIEKAHQEQIRFTADASHELRTPLAAMRSEIEVALRDKKLSKSEAIDIMHSNIEELAKLSALSEGLLKLARQDESVDITLSEVSLNVLVNKAVARVAKTAELKDVAIVTSGTSHKVLADFDTISELLVILLDNAVKYSPPESKITISGKASKGFVNIDVTDTGIGIRESDQDRIFERFYRADNSRSTQNVAGHGLGLSIARNISEIHDARLALKNSRPDVGTTFTFRLKKA